MDEESESIRVFSTTKERGTMDLLSTDGGLIAQVPSEQLAAWEKLVARAAAYDALLKSLARADG